MICIYYLLRIQSRIGCILLLKSKMKNRTPSIDADCGILLRLIMLSFIPIGQVE